MILLKRSKKISWLGSSFYGFSREHGQAFHLKFYTSCFFSFKLLNLHQYIVILLIFNLIFSLKINSSLFSIFFSYISFIAENLSRKPTTKLSQSSTYSNYYATRANDGLTTTSGIYCANTAPNHSLAWFQVDLGQFYNIWNVKIYYRKEGISFVSIDSNNYTMLTHSNYVI